MVSLSPLPCQSHSLRRSCLANETAMFRVLVLLAVAAAAAASHYPYHQDYFAYPKYAFEYAVNDPHTKDVKKQWETRDGDKVKGSYSLVEPDGTVRIVDYQADHHNGFTAVVRRQGHAYHPQVAYYGPAPGAYAGYGGYGAAYGGYGYGGFYG